MAWGSLNTLGSNQIKTSGTNNLTITTTAIAEVGNVIIVIVAGDNIAIVDGDSTNVSITDAAGNTYTRAKEWTNDISGAGTGAVAAIFYSKVTTQLNSGALITITTTSAITAKAASAWEFSIGAGNVVSVQGSAGLSTDGADPAAITISGLTSAEYLWIHCVAHEGPNTDAFTQDIDYLSLDANGTTAGGAASNMSVRGGRRIFTGTTDTVDVTYTAADHAQAYVALKEAAPPAAVGFSKGYVF